MGRIYDIQGNDLQNNSDTALLACLRNIVWTNDNSKELYNNLQAALYPSTSLVSISASFNQGTNVIYTDDNIDSLKQYLTVTGRYGDGTQKTINDYLLTGDLIEGQSTITVISGGKTATFTVNVTDYYHIARWGISVGNLFEQRGSVNTNASASPTNADMNVDTNSLNVRRTFVTYKGKAPFYTHNYLEETTYFPIPVPPNANHVSIKGIPSGHFFYANFAQYDEATGKYFGNISGNRISWTQQTGTTLEHDFTAYNNMFMFINAKNDSSGTAFTSDFTDMIIEFSEV